MPSSTFSVRTVKHPIFWVQDLDHAGAWFERVFGRPTLRSADVMARVEQRDGYRTDYANFYLVQDTFVQLIDPARLVIGGVNEFPRRGIPPVALPMLGHFGWYVDGVEHLVAELRERDLHCQNQVGELTEDMAFGGKVGFPSFYALREEAGLAYQFVDCPPSEENVRKTGDARVAPDWTLAPPAPGDALGIELCSHHTVVTQRPERLLGLWVDILGGAVVHKANNDLLGTDSTFVALGDGVFECAVPASEGLRVAGALDSDPYDTYHSMTFLVRDLDRAEEHLRAHGIEIARRDDVTIVTDPTTSYGVPWGFTTHLVPGDLRTAPSAR